MTTATESDAATAKSGYDANVVEAKWTDYWFERQLFNQRLEAGKPNYSIALPPPNITGSLHMGHAFNGTLQDMLIRHKRMQGYNVLWQPGTDHAGIAAQMVVERKLKAEGKSRREIGRAAFLKEVWSWRADYGNRIYNQYKRLGVSFSWDRQAFTMDPGYARAVNRAFVELYRQGLIYRGKRITNWCPRCLTCLSDLEVDHIDMDGQLHLIDYPLADRSGQRITIATTRPETMFGDSAIAVHSGDERFAALIGKTVRLPLTSRTIPIIADHCVERDFGTGAVKITPAHNVNDWEVGQRHSLPSYAVLDAEARLLKNELIPEQFQGLERLAARQALLEALQEQGFLKESQEHKHAVGHCNRCGTAIEPYLSDQWYLSMNELARPAIAAVEEGRIKFTPERSAQTYLDWMRNIRDWNISRQLWWGHQIPIWTCENAHTDAYESKPECCLQCGSTRLEQDPDVLDTWFSSALWPFATLGWPDESQWQELFYPTAAVSTAREIINLWVSRMIFMSLRFTGKIPFKDILIHPVIQTPDGQRMSKSKNNVIDPLEMIDKYGTDANRFFFATLGIKGDQDVRFRHERLGEYKRFANKLYNAGRFIMLNIGDSVPAPIEPGSLSLADRWILHQYQCLLEKIDRGFTGFDFHEIAQALYEFSWDLFCDWYLEIAKSQLAEEGSQGQTRSILYNIFEGLLRALHPIMPFITEELWQDLPKSAERSLESIMFAPYPVAEARFFDEQADRDMSLIIRCIRAIREMRATYNVPASSQPEALFASEADADLNALSSALPYIERIARVKSISAESPGNKPANAASASIESIKIYLPLAKVIDIGKARIRLSQRKQALEKEIERQRATLENADFKAKAPKEKALSIAETLAQKQAQLTGILEQLSVIES